MHLAYCARILTEVARQAARSVLDGKFCAIFHVSAGLSRVVLVVQPFREENYTEQKNQGGGMLISKV